MRVRVLVCVRAQAALLRAQLADALARVSALEQENKSLAMQLRAAQQRHNAQMAEGQARVDLLRQEHEHQLAQLRDAIRRVMNRQRALRGLFTEQVLQQRRKRCRGQY